MQLPSIFSISSIFLIFVGLTLSFAQSESDDLFLASNFDETTLQSDLFEDADPFDVVASTDCGATQQSLTDDLSLFSRNDDSCDLSLPLSPSVLQLFLDPSKSLENIRPTNDETPKNTDPGVFSTEQQLEEKRNPCKPYIPLGYIYHLCCEQRDGSFPNYLGVSRCFGALVIKIFWVPRSS